jgi:hypothetical protein
MGAATVSQRNSEDRAGFTPIRDAVEPHTGDNPSYTQTGYTPGPDGPGTSPAPTRPDRHPDPGFRSVE